MGPRPLAASRSRSASSASSQASAAEAEGEGLLASLDEVGVLGRRDELVLGPRDHVGEATERRHRVALEPVIEEVAHARPKVAQQQALADAVEQAGAGVEARLGGVLTEQPVAEAVEVVDPEAARPLDTEGLLEALQQLARGPHVVGQDEDVLRGQGAVTVEQLADPLDDHGGLPGAGASEHHKRTVTPLDGGPLRWRWLEVEVARSSAR